MILTQDFIIDKMVLNTKGPEYYQSYLEHLKKENAFHFGCFISEQFGWEKIEDFLENETYRLQIVAFRRDQWTNLKKELYFKIKTLFYYGQISTEQFLDMENCLKSIEDAPVDAKL